LNVGSFYPLKLEFQIGFTKIIAPGVPIAGGFYSRKDKVKWELKIADF